jgi:hypothetical protein
MSSVVGRVESEQKEYVSCHWRGTREPCDCGRKGEDDEVAYKPPMKYVGNWSQSTT